MTTRRNHAMSLGFASLISRVLIALAAMTVLGALPMTAHAAGAPSEAGSSAGFVMTVGRDTIGHFLSAVSFRNGPQRTRLIPTRANGQPAFGRYSRDPHSPISHAHGLIVLTLAGDRISAITGFHDNSVLARFGLPRTLPE